MSKRKHLRVKLKSSLHGTPIAIPKNVSKFEAAAILKRKLQAHTPVDTGNAISGYEERELSNGDMRVVNGTPYIRRLMIDGSSKQEPPGGYNKAINEARSEIINLGLNSPQEPVKRKSTNFKQRQINRGFLKDGKL